MGKLINLEPSNVFYFFEEICKIPHGSGNTQQISDYLVNFAKSRNLEYEQDEMGNVVIIKEASAGYGEHETVMLQGHMDMVAVKKPGCEKDMAHDGLCLQTEGDWLFAEDTSLGGDDGIAVAMGLALLDGADYSHPRIELVITVDEEVGMEGAKALDVSRLKATRLINLDSEDEGIFIAGCAGGALVNIEESCSMEKTKGICCSILVDGLLGGHSGGEIHKEHGNAISILGRLLCRLGMKNEFVFTELQGGVADNAIPRKAEAEILVTGYESKNGKQKFGQGEFSTQECQAMLKYICEKVNGELKEELAGKDDGIHISLQCRDVQEKEAVSAEQSMKWSHLLNSIPYGVQAMSLAVPGMVETSQNPGVLYLKDNKLGVKICVRSSINSARDALIERMRSMAQLAGASIRVHGVYPGWNYRQDSVLREKMTEVFELLYQEKPDIQVIHAGVECGILMDKMTGLDGMSIGPNMQGIHTTEERLSISSVERTWKYLLKLLAEL